MNEEQRIAHAQHRAEVDEMELRTNPPRIVAEDGTSRSVFDDAIDLRTCSLLGWTGMQWAYVHWAQHERGRPIAWMPSEAVDTISWAASHQEEWRARGADEPLDLPAAMREQDLLWAEQMFEVIARQLQASGQLWPNKPTPTLEARIAARPAPKVTPADIEAEIASEHYFTAADGVVGTAANGWRNDSQEALAASVERTIERAAMTPSLDLLTFCVLVLRNGFVVTGESACASPENFDAQIGANWRGIKIIREEVIANPKDFGWVLNLVGEKGEYQARAEIAFGNLIDRPEDTRAAAREKAIAELTQLLKVADDDRQQDA